MYCFEVIQMVIMGFILFVFYMCGWLSCIFSQHLLKRFKHFHQSLDVSIVEDRPGS